MNGDATTPSWYYAKTGAVDGQQVGPVSWEQLYALAQTGALSATDLVWNPQFPSWVTVADIPGLLTPPQPRVRDTSQEMARPVGVQPTAVRPTAARPSAIQPTAARPGAIQPKTPSRGASRPSSAYDPFLDESDLGEFGGRRSWLRWGIALGVIVVVGVIAGVYFGVIRGGGVETTTTLPPVETTTSLIETTTTEASNLPATDAMWANLSPTGDLPVARSAHAVAYDSAVGEVILFGGWDASGTYNDTWAFNSTLDVWTNRNPTGTLPAARAQHQLAYDPVSGKVILFGGVVALSGAQLGDTWAYDPAANTWTNLSPTGDVPSARDSFAMVYDSNGKKIILFGGWSNASGTHLNDTWAYDPAANTWTNLNPAGDLPPARGSMAMAYDPDEGRVILFGGWDENAYFNDTWSYDPVANTWTEITPMGEVPAVRSGHRMTYNQSTSMDAASGMIILFGGWDGTAYFNDTWGLDAGTGVWTNLNPAGDVPSARDSHSLIFNSATNELILFGGFEGGASDVQDTWSFGLGEAAMPETTTTILGTSTTVGGTTTSVTAQ